VRELESERVREQKSGVNWVFKCLSEEFEVFFWPSLQYPSLYWITNNTNDQYDHAYYDHTNNFKIEPLECHH